MEDLLTGTINSVLLEEAVSKNSCVWARVRGKSMLPVFGGYAVVCITESSFKDICVGDIAVYKKEEGLICHRVLSKLRLNGKLFLRTKADTGFHFDPLVEPQEVIGKIAALKIRNFKFKIDNLLSRVAGLFLAFFFPFIARSKFIFESLLRKI
ncbi:MAG: hypothetical protein PHN57_05145 [Candidatus Omnitrophica bacterium]|nr:hypothetical protein [Candidatus Omnitrophota bacterium]